MAILKWAMLKHVNSANGLENIMRCGMPALKPRCTSRHATYELDEIQCVLLEGHRGKHQYSSGRFYVSWEDWAELKIPNIVIKAPNIGIEEDEKMQPTKHIPPLSIDIEDTGVKYMVNRHRRNIAEAFGVSRAEYPKGLEEQRKLMKFLKAEDPQKYNTLFDTIVRGEMPEEITKTVYEELPDHIIKTARDKLKEDYESMVAELDSVFSESISMFNEKLKKSIEEESKKLNTIEHVHVVKNENGKTKKIKGHVPAEFQKVLDLASARLNILLVGPSGCGKTHMARVVAEALDLDFSGQSCSVGMSETTFSGWLLPIGEGNKFSYVRSEFVRIYEEGGVFLFDEIDAADSNTLLFLNQALANGEFFLPQRHEKPHVKKHKDFVAIAAANTFGNGATAMYSGRNLLDGATMDRFRMGIVPMDYSDKIERELIDPIVYEWGIAVRKYINNKNIRKIMSTRVLLDATKMFNLGWPIDKIHKSYISDWSHDEQIQLNNHMNSFLTEQAAKSQSGD